MDEKRFWNLIEQAWDVAPILKGKRLEKLFQENSVGWREPNKLGKEMDSAVGKIIFPNLVKLLANLNESELFKFIHILDEKINILNQNRIYEYLLGSDDGFFYARGFVTGMGKDFYDLILEEPQNAVHIESEEFAYMTNVLYEYLFGEKYEETYGGSEYWGKILQLN